MTNWNWELFEEISSPHHETQQCCDKMLLTFVDGIETCVRCGIANLNNIQYIVNKFEGGYSLVVKQPYKRLTYFKQKLAMISASRIYPKNAKLLYFISQQKRKPTKNLHKLKRSLKRSKLVKYYKFIYSIYEAINGHKLINISSYESSKYINQFMKLERVFVKMNIRHNLFSYNTIIYFLLKMDGHPDFSKVLLPVNKSRMKRKISQLVKYI